MIRGRPLSPERRHKVAQIREALGKSDRVLHEYMSQLDRLEQSERSNSTRDVSAQRIRTLEHIHDELSRGLRRLGALETGLRAQQELRKALIASAAGYAAWSFALQSRNPTEIAAAQARMKRHFDTGADHAGHGASYLERGI